MPSPVVALQITRHDAISPTSPLANPATCPTHIEVDGYGRIPVSVFTQSWLTGSPKQIRPNVHERVLFAQPVNPADMVHPPKPPSAAVTIWCLLGATLGAVACTAGVYTMSPLLAVAGGIAWLLSAVIMIGEASPEPLIGTRPEIA